MSITASCPHCATVNPELTRHLFHADALTEKRSHSVHFLLREACSKSFLWFRRRVDQRVIGPILGLRIPADGLIPRGNQALDLLSLVPATLRCFHRAVREARPAHANVARHF